MVTRTRPFVPSGGRRRAALLLVCAVPMFAVAGVRVRSAAPDTPVLPLVVPYTGGPQTTVFVLPDGSARVEAWDNTQGQLGNGSQTMPPPAGDGLAGHPVPDVTDAVGGAADESHVLLLRRDGTVLAWGANHNGQLGLGVKGSVPEFGKIARPVLTPTRVPGLEGVRKVAAGGGASFALMDDGTVRATGANGEGLLGLGEAMPAALGRIGRAHYFIEIPGLRGVKDIVVAGTSRTFVVALLDDGTLRAWGSNHHGQLGVDGIRRSAVPIPVPGVTDAIAVAAGVEFTLALRKDGTVVAWGDGSLHGSNFAGATGPAMHTEDATPWTAAPIAIPGLSNVVAIAAGSGGLALLSDGTARGWGYNGHYGLGLGRNTEYPKGLQSWKLPPVAGVAAALNSSYFILKDGSVLHAGATRGGYHKVPTQVVPRRP